MTQTKAMFSTENNIVHEPLTILTMTTISYHSALYKQSGLGSVQEIICS